MTMTSDEERRDIAAKLRSYDNSGMALRHALKSLGLPCATMGGNWVKVFDRLADLIEPEETEEGGDE